MKRKFIILIQFNIIILFVILAGNYIPLIENKIYSDNINKNVNLSTMALKLDEFKENDIYSAKDTYTGDLTGYVYNCPLCSGHLGCLYRYDISDGKNTYDDETYGTVNIVASSTNLACGTIVRFNTSRISDEPIYAIVLDRGVAGNALDFLSPDLDYALNLGRSIITYDVLRNGWGNKVEG